MIAETIRFLLTNVPAVMLVAALAIAVVPRNTEPFAKRFLSWVLLLPIGVTGLWAGLFHIAFPERAAAYIGWHTSPFQFEVGMADLAIGLVACLAFWRQLEFQTAAVIPACVSLLGDAVGHVHQMILQSNFAPGNAGVPFYTDVIVPILAATLLIIARRSGQEHTAPDTNTC